MTLPNQITIGRILFIPVFVLLAVYYGESVAALEPNETLRWSAVIVFLVAAISDGADGWIARHYKLRSKLGAILDPLADKGLMITAVITLSVSKWHFSLPLWFPILVIARDLIILLGCILIRFLNGTLEPRPSLVGKLTTFLQMLTVAVMLLQWPYYKSIVWLTGVVTLISGIGYVLDGIHLLRIGGHGQPHSS